MIVTANVLVAETDEEADFQAGPGRLMAYGSGRGGSIRCARPRWPPPSPTAVMAGNVPTNRISGSPATALAQLDRLLATTGADELMVSTVAHGLDARLRSLELLAEHWPAVRPPSAPS